MINPFVNNGNTFYICAKLPATYDSAGYAALTWTKIRGIRSTGELGDQFYTIDSNAIGGIRHNKKTGTAANSVPIELIKIDDAGQSMLKTLTGLTSSYSFKCLTMDGTAYYFTAACISRKANVGKGASIADIKATLELDSALLEI